MKDIILIGHGAIGAHMDTTTCKEREIVIIDKPKKEPITIKATDLTEIPDLYDPNPGGKAKRRERRKAERSQTKRRFK